MVCDVKDERLARAKLAVETIEGVGRKWLSTHIDSYDEESNRVTMHAYEGSPARAVIIESEYYVTVLDSHGKKIGSVVGGQYDEYPVRWVPNAQKRR